MAAELHLHLEGSVPAAELGLDPYQYTGFAGFLQCFKRVVQCLHKPEDYARITHALLRELQAAGIDYAEVTLSAGVVLWKGQDLRAVFEAIREACGSANIQWNLDAVRQFGPAAAMQVARVAAEFVGAGVVSFGLGGDERTGPAEWFHDVFRFARARGLRLTAHAGESDGPASIWQALEIGAERIGHGIRAIEDAALVRHLALHQIPLEVCLTSNVLTGVVASLEDHPARRLYLEGVPVTLNTDDPAIFGTTLAREFQIAREHLGFTPAELDQIAANAYRFRF